MPMHILYNFICGLLWVVTYTFIFQVKGQANGYMTSSTFMLLLYIIIWDIDVDI